MLLSTLLKIVIFVENMVFLSKFKMCNKTKKAPVQEFFWLEKATKFLVQQQKSSCRHCSTEIKSLSSFLAQRQSKGNLSVFVRMARRNNNASPEELTKVLSLLQKKPPQSTFYSMTTEQQIAEKEDLRTEMILLLARPTISWVSTALKMVWQRSEVENIDRFAKALTFCSQYCFQKSLQATAGAKLSPSVKRIVQTILRSSTRPLSTGDKIRRSLKRVS